MLARAKQRQSNRLHPPSSGRPPRFWDLNGRITCRNGKNACDGSPPYLLCNHPSNSFVSGLEVIAGKASVGLRLEHASWDACSVNIVMHVGFGAETHFSTSLVLF